ncbi:hypothetical protein DID88_010009 [Monilinia fructigena]|uniref:Ubiquitin-like protease family profile domain-containing protein n=1 Tax=Monilinia fructigena TaxID=38457 RepID=A0A395IKM1_9HELO|nr:hypothetical protein DID88_010009 [Monilinia fructigena]
MPLLRSERRRITRVTTSDATEFASTLEEIRKVKGIVLKDPSTYPSTKAPPPPSVPRPEAHDMDSELRLEMERRQFQPLSDDWFYRMFEEMYRIDETKWTEWAVNLEWMKVTRRDFRYLMKILDKPTWNGVKWSNLENGTCDGHYCRFARTLEGGDLAGDNPTKQKLSCIVIDTQRLFWDRSKGRLYLADGVKAPVFLPQDFPKAWSLVQEAVDQYDDETFMNLDYVFFPFEYQGFHTLLMGFAPKQRFCFHIDNSGTVNPRPQPNNSYQSYPGVFAMHLIEAVILEKFGEKADTANFPLYGEWERRMDHVKKHLRTTDNSPNAPRQRDACNCGVMTLTNAMNLAFGYDMSCFRGFHIANNPPRVGKRMRVAAELLNGGFNKPFDYPLFNIPTKLREIVIDESYRHNLRPPPQPAPAVPGFEDFDKKEKEKKLDEPGGVEGEDNEEGAENVGLGNAAQAGARTKVKMVQKYKKVKWSGQRATDPDLLDPEPSKPGSTADKDPVRTLWPAQMNPSRTGKCGCIYPIKNPRFSGPRYGSRLELKRAAHMNRMTGWQMWENMPLHLFRAWMENTMAGREDKELTPWIETLTWDGFQHAKFNETD